MMMHSHFLIIKINANIIRNVFYYVQLIIFNFNSFLNASLGEVSRIKIIIIYLKNFLLRRKVVKNVNYEIIT